MVPALAIMALCSAATPATAVAFKYGIYGSSSCDAALGGLDTNPFPADTDGTCTAWFRTDGPANSLTVTGCSAKCVCFQQYPGVDDCGGEAGATKESCVDTCAEDAQGTFLQISDFAGCPEGGEEYSCTTTGMAADLGPAPEPAGPPAAAPVATPATAPSAAPTTAPAPPVVADATTGAITAAFEVMYTDLTEALFTTTVQGKMIDGLVEYYQTTLNIPSAADSWFTVAFKTTTTSSKVAPQAAGTVTVTVTIPSGTGITDAKAVEVANKLDDAAISEDVTGADALGYAAEGTPTQTATATPPANSAGASLSVPVVMVAALAGLVGLHTL